MLVANEPCLGAVFCTYTFDPAYFEEHVLRSLLRLSGDPDEDAARFHQEARTALLETPVACFVDASVRRAGRRLPYDLHLIRERTFHPKVMLALYEAEARLAVGSGNVTRSGLEGNAELFFHRRLRYAAPGDAAMLRAVDGFLAACAELATGGGTQLAAVREELRVRIEHTPAPEPDAAVDAVFVHTFGASGLRWLADALPSDATVRRVGILSPFFERDDLDAADEHSGLASVVAEILALRPGPTPAFDLGVPWQDAPLAPPPGATVPPLEPGAGLWAWRWRKEQGGEGGADVERIDYYIIEKVTAKRVEVRDAGGRAQRLEREEVEAAIASRRMWPVPTPNVHAPARILQRIHAERPIELWLHPTATLLPSGRPAIRPLHAKLFLITVTRRGSVSTYVLVGSANASRAALGASVTEGGNVEAGVLLRMDGEVRLRDLVPVLVRGALDDVRLEERPPPVTDLDLSAWINEALHHADARTLTITWATEGPAALGPWALWYLDRAVARGDGPEAAATVVTEFDLLASSAELELEASGGRWSVPIRVADLTLLPVTPGPARLDLRALLALLGRRVGGDRLGTLYRERGPAGIAAALEAVFGEGFGPTDVFKAWWGLREDLEAAQTMAAFRLRLLGASGAREVWHRLLEVPPEQLSREEVWVYGCELVRELARASLADGPDSTARSALLAELLTSIRDDLRRIEPVNGTGGTAWLAAVRHFYTQPEAP